MKQYQILLVDDSPLILQSLGSALGKHGFIITTVGDGESAIALIDKKNFDVVITDLVMHNIDGFQVLKEAKKKDPRLKVIILTAFGSITSTIDALRLGADDFLIKPCEPQEVIYRINKCIDHLELQRKIKIYEEILPVCSVCKKIRDDSGKEHGTGNWLPMEAYMHQKAKIDFSHSYCPECAEKVRKGLIPGADDT
jgi:DNA-binding response OmpR family regulator